MPITHSIDSLKQFHDESIQFFGSELMLLDEILPRILNDRLAKAAVLLVSAGQTGEALLHLNNPTNLFSSESVMLARSFMEKMTNFCYVGVCDENEYRSFILHPVYKHYHNIRKLQMEDEPNLYAQNVTVREARQAELRKIPIVQEALTIFSETKTHLTWTKKTLAQRIDAIEKRGKLMDVFFTISKIRYYSDASEALHGSLYGCTFSAGVFDPDFDHTDGEELEKKLLRDSTCVLLHLGMLIHESFTLISHTEDIKDIWMHSYKNRNRALNLLYHVLERKL